MQLSTLLLAFLLFFSFCFADDAKADASSTLQTYIVHVRRPDNLKLTFSDNDLERWYMSFLPKTIATTGEPRMVYSYRSAISGFAARLTPEEVKTMQSIDGFMHAYPDRLIPLLTTHTPDFLGIRLGSTLWNGSNFGEGVIIGVLDTGVSPNHPSFGDGGMSPPPSKWKGACDFQKFTCNNKVIGARAFENGRSAMRGFVAPASPVDQQGHGTHTAGTAAGNFVKDAAALGNARGVASGMAPRAHLAIYKICDENGCASSDIVAGMDYAIRDGVDVMSLSLGGSSLPFYADEVAQGGFSAIEKGIFVSCAAGNSGPSGRSLSNEAPWLLTVAASNTDRSIRAIVKVGDGQKFDGESLFQPANFSSTEFPLVFPGAHDSEATYCGNSSLEGINVKGKIVLCKIGGGVGRVAKGSNVKNAGGAAMILANEEANGYSTFAEAHVLPASHVNYPDGSKIISYIASTKKPTATIVYKGTILGSSPAPAIGYFSSRGPNNVSPGILKPDITGPGVNILAAWPFQVGPPSESRAKVTFNVISGTSMSTPHLSGIAALIKSAHPDWSPAAIKSAIMTTSSIVDHNGKPILDERQKPATFFDMGAGHVNPSKANDPGLVYDINPSDYISYLCGLGYSDEEVGSVVGRKTICSKIKKIAEHELNYPSITVSLGSNRAVTVTRTVTNVGEAYSTYALSVDKLSGVSITMKPSVLKFSQLNEKKSFTISFVREGGSRRQGNAVQGNLRWISGTYTVRSPVYITF